MLNDFTLSIEPEDVYTSVVVISRPCLMAVQDHVRFFGNYPLEGYMFSGIHLRHALKIFNERLFAVAHVGVVLLISRADKALDCLSRAAVIKHHGVEALRRMFVLFPLVGHQMQPPAIAPSQ